MGWKAYRLVYQAKSPIHIGWHTLGYIKLTRYYIPGKNMWASFTDNLARTGSDNANAYKDYGKLLKESILPTYFYPALDSESPLLPEFTNEGLKYGDYTASKFEKYFIKSYGQTAVLPESNTAEDESLHESEFIAPVIEDETTKEQMPVYFVGYVFVEDKSELQWETIKDIVKEIFVGGDRKYGWGRLVLDTQKAKEVKDSKFFEYEIIPGSRSIKIKKDRPIPAHISMANDIALKGDIEPLVGREWGSSGAGQEIKLSDEKICWMPGSILQETEGITLTIGTYGILKQE